MGVLQAWSVTDLLWHFRCLCRCLFRHLPPMRAPSSCQRQRRRQQQAQERQVQVRVVQQLPHQLARQHAACC